MKIVYVYGVFNILHPGHIRLLKYARECGDSLRVGVYSNILAGSNARVDESTRLESVKSLSFVDSAFLIDDVEKSILQLKPNIVVKGKEHEDKLNSEIELLDQIDCKLIFSSGENFFSSSEIINSKLHKDSKFLTPSDYLSRHEISKKLSLDLIAKFNKLNICVIGDLIVDEYISSQAIGMSREEPSLVVTPIDSKKYVGGAGIVAMHGKGLNAKINLISVTGRDENADFISEEMVKFGINFINHIDTTRPTTLKQRFRCDGKSLLRVNHFHQMPISRDIQKSIFENLKKIIKEIDLLIFSDFNYGLLPQELINNLTELAYENGVYVSADCQSSSQTGDVSKYRKTDLLTPTEYEARLSLRNSSDGLIVLCEELFKITNAKNIILKLGAEGILIHTNKINSQTYTDQIFALNTSPIDVAGAGDSLLVISSMALCLGADIWHAAYLGSMCAAIQVSRSGNIPITSTELIDRIHNA